MCKQRLHGILINRLFLEGPRRRKKLLALKTSPELQEVVDICKSHEPERMNDDGSRVPFKVIKRGSEKQVWLSTMWVETCFWILLGIGQKVQEEYEGLSSSRSQNVEANKDRRRCCPTMSVEIACIGGRTVTQRITPLH